MYKKIEHKELAKLYHMLGQVQGSVNALKWLDVSRDTVVESVSETLEEIIKLLNSVKLENEEK
jgi:hypothetical protein